MEMIHSSYSRSFVYKFGNVESKSRLMTPTIKVNAPTIELGAHQPPRRFIPTGEVDRLSMPEHSPARGSAQQQLALGRVGRPGNAAHAAHRQSPRLPVAVVNDGVTTPISPLVSQSAQSGCAAK